MKRDNLVESIAVTLVILVVWFIAEINIIGQYCMLVAQVLWLIIGIQRAVWALAAQSLVLFGLTSRAVYLWYLA